MTLLIYCGEMESKLRMCKSDLSLAMLDYEPSNFGKAHHYSLLLSFNHKPLIRDDLMLGPFTKLIYSG